MCYSVESSLFTTLLSLIAIIILWTSGINKYKWLALTLMGWSAMQFSELILWLTKPTKSEKNCHIVNKITSVSLIPLSLMLQPLGSLYGSLFETSWQKSSETRKLFIIIYTFIILFVVFFSFFYPLKRICTVVTPEGHLNWCLNAWPLLRKKSIYYIFRFSIWGALIILPLLLFWKNKLELMLIVFVGFVGLIYGLFFTDSTTNGGASVWCFITSFSSILFVIIMFLDKYTNFYPF